MKQLTRQEVEAFIDKLEDEKYKSQIGRGVTYMASTREIYVGDMLEKMQTHEDGEISSVGAMEFSILELLDLWQPLGLSRSLQDICEASGWKEVRILPEGWDEEQGGCSCHINPPCAFCEYSTYEEVLTSPEANALFSFLQEIL